MRCLIFPNPFETWRSTASSPGKAEEVIPRLARELGAKQVYYGRTYDPSGIETQAKVEDALDQASIDSQSFNSSLLQEPWETKNGSGKPFQVFTPYWRKSRQIIYREPLHYDPSKLLFASLPTSKTNPDDLDLLPHHPWHHKLCQHWEVTEEQVIE